MKVPPPPPNPLPTPAPRRADSMTDSFSAGGLPSPFAQALTASDADPPPTHAAAHKTHAARQNDDHSRPADASPDDTSSAPDKTDAPKAASNKESEDKSESEQASTEKGPSGKAAKSDTAPDKAPDKAAKDAEADPATPKTGHGKTEHGKAEHGKPEKAAKHARHKPHGQQSATAPAANPGAPPPEPKPQTPVQANTVQSAVAAPAVPPADPAENNAATPETALAVDGHPAPKRGATGLGAGRRSSDPATGPSPDADADTAKPDAAKHATASAERVKPDAAAHANAKPDASPAPNKPFAHLLPADARAAAHAAPVSAVATAAGQAAPAADAARPNHHGDALRTSASDGSSLPPGLGTDPTVTQNRAAAPASVYANRGPVPPVVQQIALHITRAATDGMDRLTVQLQPADLGKVSAQITFHDHHHVQVVISAQRPDTLTALRDDSAALARALQDAGLHADAGSLSFQFQGQNQGQGTPGNGPNPSPAPATIALAAPSGAESVTPASLAAAFLRPGGVDLRV